MDLYGNNVSIGAAAPTNTQLQKVRVVNVGAIEFGPVGCTACTSGDSPIFDHEQNILFGR